MRSRTILTLMPRRWRRSCESVLSVSSIFAVYHVQHERFDAARKARSERWFAIGRNEVGIANCSEWMVRDYFERGELAKAAALADRAAATYWGGPAPACTSGRDGSPRRSAAVAWYTRYDDPDELLGFLVRQRRHQMEVDSADVESISRGYCAGHAAITA